MRSKIDDNNKERKSIYPLKFSLILSGHFNIFIVNISEFTHCLLKYMKDQWWGGAVLGLTTGGAVSHKWLKQAGIWCMPIGLYVANVLVVYTLTFHSLFDIFDECVWHI